MSQVCRECGERPHHRKCVKRGALWRRGFLNRTPMFVVDVEAFTPADLVAKWGDRCFYCGGEWTELDHAHPVLAGGSHTLDNCRPSCSGCNSGKGTRDKLLIAQYRIEFAATMRAIEAARDIGNWHRADSDDGRVA